METKSEVTKWGIIGTGKIAADFATALKYVKNSKIVAVSSRNEETAKEFAKKFGVSNYYVDYKKLVEDPEVQIVYVSSLHTYHKEHALACIEAKKAVLVEKAFTINYKEAIILAEAARKNKVLLMEAMWTRHFPSIVAVRSMIEKGVIGTPQGLIADFGFVNPGRERLTEISQGGGAMLDIGVYAVAFSSMILGKPSKVSASGFLGSTNVDEHISITLTHPEEKLSSLFVTFRSFTGREARILGTKGSIIVHFPFWCGEKVSVITNDQKVEVFEFPHPKVNDGDSFNYRNSIGLLYEAEYAQKLLSEGKTESDRQTIEESLEIMQTIDEIRRQIGMKYPQDN